MATGKKTRETEPKPAEEPKEENPKSEKPKEEPEREYGEGNIIARNNVIVSESEQGLEPELEPELEVQAPPKTAPFEAVPTGGQFVYEGQLYQKVTVREYSLCARPLAGEGESLHPTGNPIVLDANIIVTLV